MVVAAGARWWGDSGGGGGAGGFREVVSPSSPYTGSPLNGYPTPGERITVTAKLIQLQYRCWWSCSRLWMLQQNRTKR